MELTERIINFAKASETPFILLDLDTVEKIITDLKTQ